MKKSAFKAESIERRAEWISAINEAISFDVNTLMEVARDEVQFFKDV